MLRMAPDGRAARSSPWLWVRSAAQAQRMLTFVLQAEVDAYLEPAMGKRDGRAKRWWCETDARARGRRVRVVAFRSSEPALPAGMVGTPTGGKIAFATGVGGRWQIFTVVTGGTEATALTDLTTNKMNPNSLSLPDAPVVVAVSLG